MRAFYNSLLKTSSSTVVQKSLELNGTNQYLRIADADDLSFTDGVSEVAKSITMWVKLDTVPSAGLIGKDDGSSNREYRLFFNGSKHLSFTLPDADLDYIGRRNTNVIYDDGIWYFIAMTYNGNEANSGIKIYAGSSQIDNQNLSSGTYNGCSNTSATLDIGKSNTFYLDGKIYLPTIWNKELSVAEITTLTGTHDYSAFSTDIVEQWRFEDSNVTGSTVGGVFNGHDGTLINSPTTSTDVPSI